MKTPFALLMVILFPILSYSQTDTTSTIDYDEFFALIRPGYQHKGIKIRFDTALEIPVSQAIRTDPAKLFPGFGFNLSLGYGLTDHLSAYIGFMSVSHANDNRSVIKSGQAGFAGFHSDVRYKFNPFRENQYYLEGGVGLYELVEQKVNGFTGNGYHLSVGFDRFLTDEFLVSYSITYRVVTMDKIIKDGEGTNLTPPISSDMFLISVSFIYTFGKQSGIIPR